MEFYVRKVDMLGKLWKDRTEFAPGEAPTDPSVGLEVTGILRLKLGVEKEVKTLITGCYRRQR